MKKNVQKNNNRHLVEQFTAKVLDAVVMLMPSETAFIAFSMFSLVHCFLTDDLLSWLDRPQSLAKGEDILKKKNEDCNT